MSATVHLETSRALPLVSVLVGFKAGSHDEPSGKDGLTRLMARMLRRGAGGLDATQVEAAFDRLGADLGEVAGPTAVTLHLDVIRRSFDRAIDLVATLLGEPALDAAELAKLVREVQSEIVESRENDRGLCMRAFRRTLFEGHPFARRTGGLLATLASIGRDDVVQRHRHVVARDRLVLAFAGDLDETDAARAAARIEQALPPPLPAGERIPEPQAQRGRRLVIVDKPDRTQTQLMIGGLGTRAHDPDHVPLVVANTVFGGTFTSRIMREVRSKRGWSYGAFSSLPIDVCREAFGVWTHPAAEYAAECVALELDLLEKWRTAGIKPAELAFAKRYLVRSQAFEVDTASKRVHRKFATSVYDLPGDYYDGFLERVRAVTLEQANRAVAERISIDDLTVAITGTEAVIGEKLAGAIPGLAGTTVVPHDLE
jgi:zinc protease